MKTQQRGNSLVEALMVLVIIGIITTVSSIVLDSAARRASLVSSTSTLRSEFQRVRMMAIAHNANIAIRFRDEGTGGSWGVYEDRDGDGVRNDDIDRGVDKPLGPIRRLPIPARIGVPPGGLLDPFTGKRLDNRSAIRFNSSSLCSFTRNGEATNGSLVLTDGTAAVILQVHGESARISVHRWNGTRWNIGA